MKRVKDKNLITYYNDSSKKSLELFYEDGRISQIRFHFDDEDKSIKNKTLSLSPTHFKGGYSFGYDKVIDLGNGRVKTESYDENEKLWIYNIVEKTSKYKKTSIFWKDGELAEERIVFYNENGIPYRFKTFCASNDENYKNTDYRIPIFSGYENSKDFDDKKRDELNDLINAYLWSDFVEPYEEEIDLPF